LTMSIPSGVCAPCKGLKSGRTIICYFEVATLNSSGMVGVCSSPRDKDCWSFRVWRGRTSVPLQQVLLNFLRQSFLYLRFLLPLLTTLQISKMPGGQE
jgi:hypothetical protein